MKRKRLFLLARQTVPTTDRAHPERQTVTLSDGQHAIFLGFVRPLYAIW